MSIHNNQQDIEIQKINTDVCWLKRELADIKKQVFNDIPHQIQDIKDKIFIGFVVGIAAVVIAQIILKFL
jgi:hypothetical protein